ncbi:MAG TPA: TlpA disulfide reductase family protein [Candidatus Dormibacteraeota bacterium]|nr:TlpA disulfide reductase family protein [Candidatus Dormibacteraeota bacterium]
MRRESGRFRKERGAQVRSAALAAASFLIVTALLVIYSPPIMADSQEPAWTPAQAPIAKNIANLRSLADDIRPRATRMLAAQIHALRPSANKVTLAYELANLSTEGDQGQDTIQDVATTLAEALRQHPEPDANGTPAEQYLELASLVKYEGAKVSLDNPQFRMAMRKLQLEDLRREHINFTLTGLDGQNWTLKDLRGKVVLVNFWATWCPPCRKELPDLNAIYKQFKDKGFVVLAISDEQPQTVRSFLSKHKLSYPILIDPQDKVHKEFGVDGIPKSYLYDRDGKLVAEAMDMRTRQQFLSMLQKVGLTPPKKLSDQLKRIPARLVGGF